MRRAGEEGSQRSPKVSQALSRGGGRQGAPWGRVDQPFRGKSQRRVAQPFRSRDYQATGRSGIVLNVLCQFDKK